MDELMFYCFLLIAIPPPSTWDKIYEGGKSFLSLAKRIWKKDIKPRLGAHTYRYVDHPTYQFSMITGQAFGRDWAVLNYLKSIGVTGARVPSDGLVYLPDDKTFNGFSFINGAMWDYNVYPWGVRFMTDLELAGMIDQFTQTPIKSPSRPTGNKKTPGLPIGSTPSVKSPIPILGLIGLGYTLLKK